jgi:hypothetical protein
MERRGGESDSEMMKAFIMRNEANLSLATMKNILRFALVSIADCEDPKAMAGAVVDIPAGTYLDLDKVTQNNPAALVHIYHQVMAQVEALSRPATGPPEPKRR